MPDYTFQHIHLNTNDMDTTVDFYVDLLGARVDHRGEWNGRKTTAIDLGETRVLISDRIYPFDAPSTPGPAAPHMGLDHIGLLVDDLDEAASDLETRGGVFAMDPHVIRGSLRLAFLKGPDDVRIELIERPR